MKRFWRKKLFRLIINSLLLIILSIAFLVIFIFRPYSFGTPPSIPQGWGGGLVSKFKGQAAQPKPILQAEVPQHPFLASTNASNMHVDAFASDVHPLGGPLGIAPTVKSYAHGNFGGECASVTFDSKGNIVAVCATFKEFSLLLISPKDLMLLAQMHLPPRRSNKSLNLQKIMSDTSGGAYFFLDNQDRAVLVDSEQNLKIISQNWRDKKVEFIVDEEYSLSPILQSESNTEDVVTAVLPDWQGRYWFVSRFGLIGIVNPRTKNVKSIKLDGEEIQNSFAVDEDGTYIVSDYALYKLTTSLSDDQPFVVWREEYKRATTPKPGTLTLGSGTTPTLLGHDFVAIADNAEPQTNVLVYRRGEIANKSRLVCKVPVFKPGESATENSFIGIGNSLIVENNYGYTLFPKMMFGKTGTGGVARVDIDGNSSCKTKWTNPIISQTTVAKLSRETGLVYVYAKDPSVGLGIDAYYLSALDFDTGKTIFETFVGAGVSYDNNWAPITLDKDNCAYVGVLRGLTKICDKEIQS